MAVLPAFGSVCGLPICPPADGSIVLTRDVGSSEIYALDVKWP